MIPSQQYAWNGPAARPAQPNPAAHYGAAQANYGMGYPVSPNPGAAYQLPAQPAAPQPAGAGHPAAYPYNQALAAAAHHPGVFFPQTRPNNQNNNGVLQQQHQQHPLHQQPAMFDPARYNNPGAFYHRPGPAHGVAGAFPPQHLAPAPVGHQHNWAFSPMAYGANGLAPPMAYGSAGGPASPVMPAYNSTGAFHPMAHNAMLYPRGMPCAYPVHPQAYHNQAGPFLPGPQQHFHHAPAAYPLPPAAALQQPPHMMQYGPAAFQHHQGPHPPVAPAVAPVPFGHAAHPGVPVAQSGPAGYPNMHAH